MPHLPCWISTRWHYTLPTLLLAFPLFASTLPQDFVYLKHIDPSIIQDIRYAGSHNFVGRPIRGYLSATCILTQPAAQALHDIQTELKAQHLSLKVYDCYRPQMASDAFMAWSKDPSQQKMKAEFYPKVNKADVFKLGYVADKSSHSRGSTVDITLVTLPNNAIDMGSPYDYFDITAHTDYPNLSAAALKNRQQLQDIMKKHHFKPLAEEWWHFTLENEPYPETYFNFPVLERK